MTEKVLTTDQITPGPWGLEVTEDNLFIYAPAPVGMKVLATVDIGFDEPFESQQWANAKLMRVAPELLEIARKMLAAWEGAGPAIVLDEIRAVIAKAEGRS